MLTRITEYCTMGCSHCLVDADEDGTHMDIDTFRAALEFSRRFDSTLLISGGEPTQHPRFLEFLDMIPKEMTPLAGILSNGMFLEDEGYAKEILSRGIYMQVTNDERFYPKRIKLIEHPLIAYEDRIRCISPFGRAVKNKLPITQQYPGCFNLRSLAGAAESFLKVIFQLRLIARKFCTPSVNIDGSVSAGETRYCGRIGTVHSTDEELLGNARSLKCETCGLSKNLEGKFKEVWEKS